MFHLRRNNHHNQYLQNSFNKYGEETFSFTVIDNALSLERLNELEIRYIDELGHFNVRVGGDNTRLSDNHRESIAKALVGNTNGRGKSKPVYQRDMEGNVVRVWDRMADVVNEWQLSSSSPISRCCLGKRNHYKGYKWTYYNDVNGNT